MENRQIFFDLFSANFEGENIAFFLKEHFLYKDYSNGKVFKHNLNILKKIIEKTNLTIARNCNHPIINIFIYEFCMNEDTSLEKLEFLRSMTLPADFEEVFKFYGEKYYDDGRHQWDERYLEGLNYAKNYLNDFKILSFANSINALIDAYFQYNYEDRKCIKELIKNEIYDMFIVGKGLNENLNG